MKRLILILFLILPLLGFSQDHIFTEKEVIKLDSLFQVYEQTDSIQKIEINLLNKQLFNYNTLHQQDSIHLIYLGGSITLLNERIDLYIDLTKELKPKWYKKPAIHFFLGMTTIVASSWVVSNIK